MSGTTLSQRTPFDRQYDVAIAKCQVCAAILAGMAKPGTENPVNADDLELALKVTERVFTHFMKDTK